MAEVEPGGSRTSLVLVDTSALFALHRAADEFHGRAWAEYERLLDHGLSLWTTSYVLVETVALMDRRLGFASVLDFEGWREAHIEVLWIDASSHEEAWRQYATHQGRDLNFVDWTTVVVSQGIGATIFTFDSDFANQGMPVIPA